MAYLLSFSLRSSIGVVRQSILGRSTTAKPRTLSYLATSREVQVGKSRLVVTEGQDAVEVQDKYEQVTCRLGTVDDYACDICGQSVANSPVLHMEKEQDDTYYAPVSCTLCKPCVLAMFTCWTQAHELFTAKK